MCTASSTSLSPSRPYSLRCERVQNQQTVLNVREIPRAGRARTMCDSRRSRSTPAGPRDRRAASARRPRRPCRRPGRSTLRAPARAPRRAPTPSARGGARRRSARGSRARSPSPHQRDSQPEVIRAPARRRRRPRRPCRGRARRPSAPSPWRWAFRRRRARAVGGEHRLEEDLRAEPPEARVLHRHGALGRRGVVVTRENAQQQRLAGLERPQSVQPHALLGACPPTKPWIVPSPSTSAASPVRTLVGRCARTTVATTNGVRAPRSSSARRLRLGAIIGPRQAHALHAQPGVELP